MPFRAEHRVDLAISHPKEIQTSNPIYENGRPYVYGKQNTLQILVWYGKQNLRSEKLARRCPIQQFILGLWSGVGGFETGLLEIGYPDILYDYTATERYDPDAHFSTTFTAGPI